MFNKEGVIRTIYCICIFVYCIVEQLIVQSTYQHSLMIIEKLHLLMCDLFSNELVSVYLLLGDLNNILCQCRWVFVSN